MWFKDLTGFSEVSFDDVRKNLIIENDTFISLANSRRFTYGELQIPTLEEIRNQNPQINDYNNKIQVTEIVADVRDLHIQTSNTNALFQVASQFNLLEMISPNITPEMGVSRYEYDLTQGPICAISCGAGTIYRNYFVEVNGKKGQTENNQIDCLELIGKELENERLNLWQMKNGYALPNQDGILTINEKIAKLNDAEREYLKGKLKVGIQWQTEVTLSETKHKVSQIYCSALPVAYSHIESSHWESFARIILEALYEATLFAGMINMEKNNSNLIYLTFVGGGVFGNEDYWILESMQKAIKKFKSVPLNVKIVSYRRPKPNLKEYFKDI